MKALFRYRKILFITFSLFTFLLVYISYRGLFRTFYQQDEWMAIGIFFTHNFIESVRTSSLVDIFTGANRILSLPLLYIFFHLFKFQIWLLAIFSILIHTANGILVYAIISLLTGNILAAWVGGIFFVESYNGMQALTWFASSSNALPATFFGLLSILFIVLYIRKNKSAYIMWGQVSLIASYYFKELGIMLVIFLPLMLVLLNNKKLKILNIVKLFSPLLVCFAGIVVLKVFKFMQFSSQVGVFVGKSSGGITQIIKNAIFYPIISFSQVFIPYPLVIKINPAIGLVSQFTDILFFSASVALLLCIAITAFLWKEKRSLIITGTILILLSFVPYAVLMRGSSYLDSRYFYFGMAAGGILLGIYADIILSKFRFKSELVNKSILCVIILIILGYSYKNLQFIQREINRLVLVADERKSIIRQVQQIAPIPPKNPIFFVSGSSNYYFIPNQRLPFQQGIGYTFMSLFYPTGRISRELLSPQDNFFWDVKNEGYKEENGRGFGYFWDKEQLGALFKQNRNLNVNQIVGLYYDSNNKKIIDITAKIREYILNPDAQISGNY